MVRSDPKDPEANKDVEQCFKLSHDYFNKFEWLIPSLIITIFPYLPFIFQDLLGYLFEVNLLYFANYKSTLTEVAT